MMNNPFKNYLLNVIINDTFGARYLKGKHKKGCIKGKRFVARVIPMTERKIARAAFGSITKAMPWLMLD